MANELKITKDDLQGIVGTAVAEALKAAGNMQAPAANISNELAVNAASLDRRRAEASAIFNRRLYQAGATLQINIPKVYQPYAGNTITVSHNGNTVKVPVDGRNHKISYGHYLAVKEKLLYIDNQIERSKGVDNFTGTNAEGDFHQIERI